MAKGAHKKFDDDAKRRFLAHYRENGRLTDAAIASGVIYKTARRHIVNDPAFAEEVEDAKMAYRDRISAEVFRRGVEGWDEPVYQRGERVGYVRRYSDRMLEIHAKRFEPEYRDKQQVDMNHSGGVLVVGSISQDSTTWAKQWANLQTDNRPAGDESEPDDQHNVRRG